MQKYSDVVYTANGTPVAGAVITVTTYPDGAAATIYAADGGPSVASVTTNVNGRFSFYAANGHYSILVSGTGITPVTYNDVVLFDAADNGAATVKYGTRTLTDKLGEFVSIKDAPFNANGGGVIDDTAAIQAALNSGAVVVHAPKGKYLVTAAITIPVGVKLIGEFAGHESTYKSTVSSQAFKGTVFLMRSNAQFLMSDNSAFEGAVLWYDQQNYNINANLGQPDQLDPFTIYPPAFNYIGNYSAVAVEKVLFLGGTHFFFSGVSHQLEKPVIRKIYGFPLITGIEIQLSTDMIWVSNIHWNPNSMYQLPGYTATTSLTSKYTRNTVPFKFGRVDGGVLDNIFTYCCRDFIWLSSSASYPDNVGGSVRVANFGADICHNLIKIDETQRGFGISLVNGWAVNNVNTIYDPAGGVVSRNPAMVRFGATGGASLENCHVEMVAVKRSPGRAVTGIPDTGTPQNVFYFDSSSSNLSITCTACDFDEVNSYVIVGSDLDAGTQRYVALSSCSIRGAQTEANVYYDTIYASQNSSYSPFFELKTGYMAIGNNNPQYSRRARDYGESNFMGFQGLYKDGSGNQKIWGAYRETGGGTGRDQLLEIDRATGDVVLGASAYNQNRLRLGAYYLWVDSAGKVRIKSAAPASDTDGTVVGTQT